MSNAGFAHQRWRAVTWPGNPNAPRSTFRRPDADFDHRLWTESELSVEACPGPGRCHGPRSWCDECGDVADVCNAIVCHRHRCEDCYAMLREEEKDAFFLRQQCKDCETIAGSG